MSPSGVCRKYLPSPCSSNCKLQNLNTESDLSRTSLIYLAAAICRLSARLNTLLTPPDILSAALRHQLPSITPVITSIIARLMISLLGSRALLPRGHARASALPSSVAPPVVLIANDPPCLLNWESWRWVSPSGHLPLPHRYSTLEIDKALDCCFCCLLWIFKNGLNTK